MPPTHANTTRLITAGITLLISALMLFTNFYPLWDDEAQTCLISQGVWNTGDTSAQHGQNIVAYRHGLLIKNGKERSSPPLQFYVAAPFVGLFGNSAWAARFPFALFGLAAIALMLWWAWKDGADTVTFILLAIAIVGNVSLMLYLRQARYYAPMIFFAVAVVYSYWHLESRRAIWLHAILSVLLLASNYLAYGAVTIAMIVDYLLWGRKRRPIKGVEWIMLLAPQAILGGIILLIWNPLSISAGDPSSDRGWLMDRITLLGWTLRDADRCELLCAALMLLAIPVAIWKRNVVLVRALVALVLGILAIDIASPQSPRAIDTADVRYFVSLLPLGIVISVLTLRLLAGRLGWIALIIAPLAFFTNLLDFSAYTFAKPRVTTAKFLNELMHPVPDPYTKSIEWINANVKSSQSIAALPDFATYPLMFHCPQAMYAWQLLPDQKSSPQFKDLPAINFFNQQWPDYFVCFGPVADQVYRTGLYEVSAILDVYPRDLYRPELMWRTFEPLQADRKQGLAVFILHRRAIAPTQAPPAPVPQPAPTPSRSNDGFHL
jgi:hypothetical protein